MSAESFLSDAMEFDCPIEVRADGSMAGGGDIYRAYTAPELTMFIGDDGISTDDADLFDQADSEGWELLTGYTGQYGYNGPVMHSSEYIGGRLARDILERPGIYVSVIVGLLDDEEPAGWAVCRKK